MTSFDNQSAKVDTILKSTTWYVIKFYLGIKLSTPWFIIYLSSKNQFSGRAASDCSLRNYRCSRAAACAYMQFENLPLQPGSSYVASQVCMQRGGRNSGRRPVALLSRQCICSPSNKTACLPLGRQAVLFDLKSSKYRTRINVRSSTPTVWNVVVAERTCIQYNITENSTTAVLSSSSVGLCKQMESESVPEMAEIFHFSGSRFDEAFVCVWVCVWCHHCNLHFITGNASMRKILSSVPHLDN
jgi:hypothetical protein